MFRKVIALLASASILLILAACQPEAGWIDAAKRLT